MTQYNNNVIFVTFRLCSSNSKGQEHKKKYKKNVKGGLRVKQERLVKPKSNLIGDSSRIFIDKNAKQNVRQPLRRCGVKEMRVNRINGTGIAKDGSMHMTSDVPKKFARNTLLIYLHTGNGSMNSFLRMCKGVGSSMMKITERT